MFPEALELLALAGEDEAAVSGGFLSDLLSADLPMPLDSSWLKVRYNIGRQTATVQFPNGSEERYTVPIVKMINWFRADSPGAFYNAEIRGGK